MSDSASADSARSSVMRRFRYKLVRGRVIRFMRLAGIVVLAFAALLALIQVQRSALQTIQASATGHVNTTPLLTLSDVEIRARSGGMPLLHFTADSLTLARDLREVQITGVRGGADTPAKPMPGGSPIAFTAAQATLLLAPGLQDTANLRLAQASADTRIGSTSLHLDAPGLVWQWPHGLVQTIGRVNAQVGGLGNVQCAGLSLDTNKRMINFGPFQATIILAALGSAVSLMPTSAHGASTPAPSATGVNDGNLHIYGQGSSHYSDNNSVLTINGPVRVVKGNVSMRTVGVVYDNKTQVATAQTPVTINDNQNTLTGTHGTLNFGSHIATITGDVHMSGVPSGTPKSNVDAQASQPTNLTCDHVTYNYRTKLADADGHLKVFQTGRTVTAETGHYDVNAQLITMHGNVDGRSTDGKHLQAPEALVSVDPTNQWIEVQGPISYEFPMSDQDNPLPPAAHPRGGASSSAPSPASDKPPTPPAPASTSTAPPPVQPSQPSSSTTSAP